MSYFTVFFISHIAALIISYFKYKTDSYFSDDEAFLLVIVLNWGFTLATMIVQGFLVGFGLDSYFHF